MPQKVTCGNCNAVLYEGLELNYPDTIINKNFGYCPNPKCEKKLELDLSKVEIIPYKSDFNKVNSSGYIAQRQK